MAPVIPRAGRAQIIAKAISNSQLWPLIETLRLKENERLNRTENITPAERRRLRHWGEYLLQIGEDRVPKIRDLIELPKHLLSTATNVASLIDETYGCLNAPESKEQQSRLLKHAILTPKNVDVRSVNKVAIDKLGGVGKIYESINTVVDDRHACQFTEENLQGLVLNNFPAHKLELKVGAPIMVLRNIDPLNGVCNGTKGIVTRLLPHLLEMITTDAAGNDKTVLIHRISLTPSDAQIPVAFKRRQFPVALCFAATVNKSQGQTLEKVGLYLPKPVFGHGQLYVALSRVTHPDNIKILVETTGEHGTNKELGDGVYTKNIVYTELLSTVGIIDEEHPRPPATILYDFEEDESEDVSDESSDEEEWTSLQIAHRAQEIENQRRYVLPSNEDMTDSESESSD